MPYADAEYEYFEQVPCLVLYPTVLYCVLCTEAAAGAACPARDAAAAAAHRLQAAAGGDALR